MLTLSRKVSESIHLFAGGTPVVVYITSVDRGRVKVSFEAEESVDIYRTEVLRDAPELQREMEEKHGIKLTV
jgi:carbon storage regulator CsrA